MMISKMMTYKMIPKNYDLMTYLLHYIKMMTYIRGNQMMTFLYINPRMLIFHRNYHMSAVSYTLL